MSDQQREYTTDGGDVMYPDAGKILLCHLGRFESIDKDVTTSKGYYTMSNGCPLDDPLYTEAASRLDGKNRKVSQAIQDSNTIDISHNTRERIPERYVHAKGVGAFGVFEVTSNTTFDVTNYTDAKFLNKVGKKTRLLARFSTVAGERGFPDTVRDTKGAAFKLYTEDGNLDWLFLNPEIFPIRDPSKFPSLVHATKRDPASGLQDANMLWDYFNNHPEGYNFLTWLFSDEGTPKCYSKMQAHSVHCYSFTKKDTSTTPATWKRTLVRIKAVPDPPIDWENDYFNLKMATTIVGKDPDWLRRGLYNEIINKNYPTWKVMAQIVQNPAASDVNVFDATKVLSELNFPWQEFGKITLNECPRNFFSQVEQAAFNPANVVPGWDVSPDPVLQIRLFTYGDTQRYRLGANNDQLLPNRACSYVYTPTRRDGAHSSANYGNTRNYIRENDNNNPPSDYKISSLDWVPEKIERFKSSVDDSDYQQCADHYRWLHENDLARNFIRNVAASLSTAHEPTRHAAYAIFSEIDKHLHSGTKGLKDKIQTEVDTRAENNIKMSSQVSGFVAGGEPAHEGLGYVPPTAPDPMTEVVSDFWRKL